VVIAVFAGTLLAAPSLAAGPVVHIHGTTFATYHFAPRRVTVTAPATVRWRWQSNAAHNVTFAKLGEASATGLSGTYKLRFETPGKFHYVCTVHGFRGAVIVN
jgi:plastocyanin